MGTTIRWVGVLLVAATAVGCSTGKPRPAQVPGTLAAAGDVVLDPVPEILRAVDSKNYTIGRKQVAVLGEALVDVRDYTASERINAAVVIRPFRQSCLDQEPDTVNHFRRPVGKAVKVAPRRSPGEKPTRCMEGRLKYVGGQIGDRHDVSGVLRGDDVLYYAIRFDVDDGTLYMLADENGRLRPDRYLAWHAAPQNALGGAALGLELLDVSVPLVSDASLFSYERQQETIVSSDGSRFEIVYHGTTHDHRGTVYHLLYREFGRTTPAVPIHVQDLEFTGTPQTIDVLGMRIRVHEVDAKRISYTVVSD